jgi:hypothetical protein
MSQLRISMIAGASYDVMVGLVLVVALEPLSRLLPIPFPAEPFYARMLGVLLAGLGVFYAFAAHDLERNLRCVAGAILIRLAGGGYLVAYAALSDIAPFFYVFGAADLAFGAWHLMLLHRERRIGWLPLLLRGAEVPVSASR